MGFRGLSRNCSGGGNMMSSLAISRGMSFHFPVLSGGFGFFC